ncbi:MAG: ABC transporter permease [Aestuariivirga sp.]
MISFVKMGSIAIVIIALWQALVIIFALPVYILPGPIPVALALWNNQALIADHALVTLIEILGGLVFGVSLGVCVAIIMAWSSSVRALLQPLLIFSQAIPIFALAPILTLWFGYGFGSKIAMTLLIIFFPVASSFFDGLMRTRNDWLELAQIMRAPPSRIMFFLRVPAAMPSLASGLNIAAVYAPIGAVIGEWVGASRGLGYLMLLANGRAKIDLMFAALIVLIVMTMLLRAAVHLITNKVLNRYIQT